MLQQIVKRTGAVVPFNKERITNAIYRAAVAVGGRDRQTAERLADEVVEELDRTLAPNAVPTVEQVQDVVERTLINHGHARTAKAYILYREERAQRRLGHARRIARVNDNVPWRKLWESLDWAIDHGVNTIAGLNARIEAGEFAELVREADHAYNDDITCAAERVRQQSEDVRLVVVAGPSSSGKTTTTTKLSHLLRTDGLNLVPLTVDNYFYDLQKHPRDEFGDYDYETPQALDLQLLSEHLEALLAGSEVRIPFYDFATGQQHPEHTPMRLGPNDIILIDSLHGLYPEMTKGVASESKFAVYIEPLLQTKTGNGDYVRWTDLRLMRRMVRDAAFRHYNPRQTLEHWHYVRTSELRNIIPYANTTDYVVNSSLPYELPIMKRRLESHFAEWCELYHDDPLREDAYRRAARVYELLREVAPVPSEAEAAIPPDSLLREFIGGSCYEY